jgi:hypothetical protein
MRTVQEMKTLLMVEGILQGAKKSVQYEFENRIHLVVNFPENDRPGEYLTLHDFQAGYVKDHPAVAAERECKNAIVKALNEYKLKLARIIGDDLNCYVDYFGDPQEPDVNNESPLCGCGEPTCNGTCYPIQ